MQSVIKLTLIVVILYVISLIGILVFTALIRRVSRSKKYKELDKQKEYYQNKLSNSLSSGKAFLIIEDFLSKPKSIKWLAIEDILLDLIHEDRYKKDVKELFDKLGYIAFYEKRLQSRNITTKSSAIDKLGKMLSIRSTGKLTEMLKSENTEICSVTIRALSKIGSIECLENIMVQLPDLFKKELVSRKMVEASLINFGTNAVPVLLKYGRTCKEPRVIATVLEVLSNFKDKEVLSFALDNLTHSNAEIRAKALKSIGAIAGDSMDFDGEQLVPLLHDKVWFVRLQAAKALGNFKHKKAVDTFGALLLDENWHVRDAAAMALTKIGDISIALFLKTLRANDDYAKESICEEIEKTNLVYRLIEHLNSNDEKIYEQSKEILKIMHFLNFSTPLLLYIDKGGNNKIKDEIFRILNKEKSL